MFFNFVFSFPSYPEPQRALVTFVVTLYKPGNPFWPQWCTFEGFRRSWDLLLRFGLSWAPLFGSGGLEDWGRELTF